MAPRESDPAGGAMPIPKWFLALVGFLALPIAGGALAMYMQLTQLHERLESQRAQLTRVESATTAVVTELRETSRATAIQAQAAQAQAAQVQRQESRAEALEVRTRELERVCLPRR